MMKRSATCVALLLSLCAVVLLSSGCDQGADGAKVKGLNRRIKDRDKKIDELKKANARLKTKIASLSAAMAPSPKPTTESSGENPAIAATRKLLETIKNARTMMIAMQTTRGKVPINSVVITTSNDEQLLITRRIAHKPRKITSGGIRRDVFTGAHMPHALANKHLSFKDFDVIGTDADLDLLVLRLPQNDLEIKAPRLSDETKLDRTRPVRHIGWPTPNGRMPKIAELETAFAYGTIKQLPAENDNKRLVITFAAPGGYKAGDPIFDERGLLVGIIREVRPQPKGAEVHCIPGSRLIEIVDRLMSVRRRVVANSFQLDAKIKALVLTRDGKLMAGISQTEDVIYFFNPTNGKLVRRVDTQPGPTDLAECNGKLFVTCRLGQSMMAIDLASVCESSKPSIKLLRLPVAQPTLIAAPVGGRGQSLYVLCGQPPLQVILDIEMMQWQATKNDEGIKCRSISLSKIGKKVAQLFARGKGISQMHLSATGDRMYLLPESGKPRSVVFNPRNIGEFVHVEILDGPKMRLSPYGGRVFAGERNYTRNLAATDSRVDGYPQAFHERLPYFVTMQSRGKKASINPRLLQNLDVDVLSIYATARNDKIATVALPPLKATWAKLAADGKVYLVNHRTGRCVVIRTDVKAMTAKAPNPFVNIPPSLLLVGQSFSFDPKLLRPKASADRFVALDMPKAMKLNKQTGKLTWTPTPADMGVSNITLRFKPAIGRETDLSFRIKVNAPKLSIATRGNKSLTRAITSPDGKKIYALDSVAGDVVEIDAVNMKILKRITVGAEPVDCDFRDDKLYVLCAGAKAISIVDIATGKVEKSIILRNATSPFAISVSEDDTIFIGHDSNSLLQINVDKPQKQKAVESRERTGVGYSPFEETFIRLASDMPGSYLAVMPTVGQYMLFSVQGGRLTLSQKLENFIATSNGLIDLFPKQATICFLDDQRRRWFVKNRVYELRGSASKVQSLKGELLIARAGSKFVYSLAAGQDRVAKSNAFTSTALTIFDVDTLKELTSWNLPDTLAYDVLEVKGGLILIGKNEISRIPIDLQSLLLTSHTIP